MIPLFLLNIGVFPCEERQQMKPFVEAIRLRRRGLQPRLRVSGKRRLPCNYQFRQISYGIDALRDAVEQR